VAENKVASMYRNKQATAQQAEAVVDALLKVFDQPLFDWERPRVMVDTWEQGRTVVVWEEGPHGWISVFPCGGMLSGTSWEVPERTPLGNSLDERVAAECRGCNSLGN
jgi:hypothetical protein